MTDTARYRQLIDAALAYRDAWRARKPSVSSFGKNHASMKSFSKRRPRSSTKT